MATWKHTGFSVDASVRISPGDKEGLFRLLRYMARPPLAKERLAYDRATGTVTLFSAKDRARIVATHNVLEFLALLALQVPPKGSHLIRYYGHYASRCRYLREKNNPTGQPENTQSPNTVGDTPKKKAKRKRWAQLIKQVFELNPLRCHFGAEMKIVAFVSKAIAIELTLTKLNIALEEAPPRGPPSWYLAIQASQWIAQHQDFYPPEEDLPQHGPSPDDYQIDPTFPD